MADSIRYLADRHKVDEGPAKKGRYTLIDRICAGLVSDEFITEQQLAEANAAHIKTKVSLARSLVSLGFITEESLMAYVAGKLEIPEVDLKTQAVDQQLIRLVPEEMARRRALFPVKKTHNAILVAMANPGDIFAIEELKMLVGTEIKPAFASEDSIANSINQYYRGAYTIERTARNISRENVGIAEREDIGGVKLVRITEQPPIVKLVDEIILEALVTGASDIHIEPQRETVKVRYRTDGALQTIASLPKHLGVPVVSRIKILAELDIAERRVPQDGQILRVVGKDEASLRVSTFPTTHGEKVVLRILGKGACTMDLGHSGLSREGLETVRKLVDRPHGLILVCGPTGCGKSTTLYSLLNIVNSDEKNIVTLEDPVEFDVKNVNQAQVFAKRGLTFASGLRAILRQDPNVVMVGEMRDLETAELAIRASLTGHLVMSTLHTNDAVGVITRLKDMGFDEFLISSALSGVIAQRLVRRICVKCKTDYEPDPAALASAGLKPSPNDKFFHGAGCDNCRQTGYKGRIGIYEVLAVDDMVKQLILAKASEPDLRAALNKNGFINLMQDGLAKARNGLTTIDEILRETKPDE
jgi:type IV pilus assembly protein PilB